MLACFVDVTIVSPRQLRHKSTFTIADMVMTRSMIAKQNQQANSRKRLKTCDKKGDSASWSDMFDGILLSIILKLGVIDFISFGGVCKSWRKVAVTNKKMFMLSRLPMHVSVFTQGLNMKDCYLEDLEGRKFKTILPRFSFRKCVGSICGYLIMLGRGTRNFKLLNLITRHELCFPRFPFFVAAAPENIRCTLVFIPTMQSWAFVVSIRFSRLVSFAFVGGRRDSWTHLCCDSPICDLRYFQGKIYALSIGFGLYEVRLRPNPILTKLKMKTLANSELMFPEFAALGGKLHVIGNHSKYKFGSLEVDFEQMKWLKSSPEELNKYAWFVSFLRCGFAKIILWTIPGERYETLGYSHGINERDNKPIAYSPLWYCPHECLDVNLLHE